jgi:CRP/FNR family transcriptional regulator
MDIKTSFAQLENILVLKKSALFTSVSTSDLRAVADVAEELRFRADEIIVTEGDIGDALYLIKSGLVKVTKEIGPGRSVDLATMEAGECFGEMAAIDEEVRSATVAADGECIVLRISKDDLLDVLREYPHISVELLRIFVKRLRHANRQIENLSQEPAGGIG